MTIDMPATKKCPNCAEEIKVEALVCRFCGTRFAVERRGYCTACHQQVALGDAPTCPRCGGEVIDITWHSHPLEAESPPGDLPPPPPPPSQAAAPPQGEVREGIVGSVRMRTGEVTAGLAIAAMIVVSVLAMGEVEALIWAERSTGFALPAPGYVVGALLAALFAGLGMRALLPRVRDVGAAAKRKYRRRVRDEYGLTAMYAGRGMRGWLVGAIVVLIGMGGIVFYNLSTIADDSAWEPRFGIYLALVLVGVALVGCLLAWPPRRPVRVLMDRTGGIHRLDGQE